MLQRFFTDALSNSVVLDDVEAFRGVGDLAQLLQNSGPLRMLLHERTHHASFDSRVGAALGAVAAFGGQHQAAAAQPGDLSLSERDLIIARSGYRVLEPLIEGLALFAEHDVVPLRDASAVSGVTDTVLRLLFGGATALETALDGVQQTLLVLRGTPNWIHAKTELLTQPLAARPSYLLGYLGVKGLYWTLTLQCKRFVNPDLFLLLMLDYWFRDTGLAAALERFEVPGPVERSRAELLQIVDYLEERSDLLIGNVDRYLDELLAFLETGPDAVAPLDSPGGPSYRNSPATTDIPLGRLLRAGSFWLYSAAGFFSFRTDFRFASSPVRVHIDDDRARVTTAAGRPIVEGIPVVPGAAGAERVLPGTIEGVMTPHCGSRLVIVISAVDGLVAVRDWSGGPWNAPDLVDYFDKFPSSVEVMETKQRILKDHALTAAHPLVAAHVAEFDEVARQAARHVYVKWAQPRRSPEQREAFASALDSAGFAGVLSPELCQLLGHMSLRCGCHVWDYGAASRAEGWDPAPLVAKLHAINEALHPLVGGDTFVIKDGRVSSRF